MAIEEVKKVSKLDMVLNKIDAFFEGLTSKKDEPEEDDMESKKADEEEAKAETKPASKKATDEEDSQDPDDGEGDDKEDEDDDAYAKKDAEIKRLNSIVAQQSQLLKEAKSQLEVKNEEVREEIKSTFKPAGSQRSTKTAVKAEAQSWATPTTDLAKRASKMASNHK